MVRRVPLLLILSLLPVPLLADTASVASGDIAVDIRNGAGIAAAQCAMCHGTDGNTTRSPAPKLAGQYAAYLYRQLQLFQHGDRRSDIMSPLTAKMSAVAMRDVAVYYAQQAPAPDPVADPALARRGEAIFHQSRGAAGGQTCAQCHVAASLGMPGGMMQGGGMMHGGMTGQGMMGQGMMAGGATQGGMMHSGMMDATTLAMPPRLQGQHADYLLDQLNRYARGQRGSAVMRQAAAALRPDERHAVAVYLSSQR